MINFLSCIGFRGLADEQTLNMAVHNGKRGSGLTILVGPNGGGKSTIVECFQKLSINNIISFTSGKRNKKAGDKVSITIFHDGVSNTLSTLNNGGSEAEWSNNVQRPKVYYLPARRVFNPFFSKNPWSRDTYIQNLPTFQYRANTLDSFSYRLFDINKNPEDFNELFWKVLGYRLEWTIDQEDSGQYFVKVKKGSDIYHNSDGLGEGIVSLLFIVDAIFNAKTDEVIVIDEPELSLHPQLQMRLLDELLDFTKDHQVLIATHSPTMISIESIINGGIVSRVHEIENATVISSIDDRCRNYIESSSKNINNPHIFGNDARSCFFAEDGYIITEGQEDIMLYPKIIEQLKLNISIPFFGFGAGGASCIIEVAHLLFCLGFKRIGAIYDGDKKADYDAFNHEFSPRGYKAWIIPADDVRDKEERTIPSKSGLLNERRLLKEEYKIGLSRLLKDVNLFINS